MPANAFCQTGAFETHFSSCQNSQPNSLLRFTGKNVYRGSELITEGEVRVGAVSRRTMAPAAMPESLYEKIRALLDLAD